MSGNRRSCYLRGTVIPWHFRCFRCMNPGIVSIPHRSTTSASKNLMLDEPLLSVRTQGSANLTNDVLQYAKSSLEPHVQDWLINSDQYSKRCSATMMFGDYEERQRGQYCKDCGSVENLGSAEGGVRDLTISATRPATPERGHR